MADDLDGLPSARGGRSPQHWDDLTIDEAQHEVTLRGQPAAHRVSRHIVQFVTAHGASVLVFEHLGHFTPQKGTYSKRGNEKRSYWLKGRIFHNARYKAWNEGIVTCRVKPRNTSRECARCQSQVFRYDAGQPTEGYTPGAPLVMCPQCQMHGNADRNASLVIGRRLISKYRAAHLSQEKPHAPLRAERPANAGGVRCSQDAGGRGRPFTDPVRHGRANAQGTAQETSSGMAEKVSGIPLCWLLSNIRS
jgi:putative transposase